MVCLGQETVVVYTCSNFTAFIGGMRTKSPVCTGGRSETLNGAKTDWLEFVSSQSVRLGKFTSQVGVETIILNCWSRNSCCYYNLSYRGILSILVGT